MTAFRVEGAGRIDRARPLRFHFDDVEVRGFAGDTIASALLASGVNVVGRSFKDHRPRGVWGFGVEDPNSLVDIAAPVVGANAQATKPPALDGMRVKSVNGRPNVARDRGLSEIEGLVLANNSGMLRLMRSLGFAIKSFPEDYDFKLCSSTSNS